MEHTPLVSVIMPAYNTALFISEAINSVRNQSYPNWELIIIDDASTDTTVSIAENIMIVDPRIKLLKNTHNKGSGISRNLGIKGASGKFIAFLDSDDLWLKHKLEVQVKFMKENDLAMTYSSYLLMNEVGGETNKIVEALPFLTYHKLLRSNYVGNLTGIYDVEKIGKVYAPSIRKRQDWALWLIILRSVGKTKGILQPLAIYRQRRDALSNDKTALLKHNFRIYRKFLDFSLLKSYRYMGRFLWEHFLVKRRQIKKVS